MFDVSDKSVAGRVPLDQIKHMPRVGERIFLPVEQSDGWAAYKIVDIEYFLNTNEGPLDEPGMLRVTVYALPVRPSDDFRLFFAGLIETSSSIETALLERRIMAGLQARVVAPVSDSDRVPPVPNKDPAQVRALP